MANPNPNEPFYPYGGGSDNPGDNTAYSNPGYPSDVASVETGLPPTQLVHPPILPGLAVGGTDTVLPAGMQALPVTGFGWEAPDDTELDTDTGGVTIDPLTGDVRESGQDETVGESETSSGIAPSGFPEPNP